MECVISKGWQRWAFSGRGQGKLTSTTGRQCSDAGVHSLRLTREGEWVRIVGVDGGKGIHDRLAGAGLRIGARIQVLRNPMDGKLLLGHEDTRLYLGGGMAHKIQVIVIKGECE